MRKIVYYMLLLLFSLIGLAQAVDTTRIQVKRGREAQLPLKAAMGEPLFTTDSHRVFFGYSTGKEELLQRSRFQSYTAVQAAQASAFQTALAGKQPAFGFTPVSATSLVAALSVKTDLSAFSGYTSQQRALVTDPRFIDSRNPLPHNQGMETITGLQSALDGKQSALGFTPVNTTDPRLSDARTPLTHSQPISTVTGLQSVLDTLQPVGANVQTHINNLNNPHLTTAIQVGAEPNLGQPDLDGKVLTSTAMGVRLWAEFPAMTRSSIIGKINETPIDNSLPLHYKKADGVDLFSIDPSTGTVTITGVLIIK